MQQRLSYWLRLVFILMTLASCRKEIEKPTVYVPDPNQVEIAHFDTGAVHYSLPGGTEVLLNNGSHLGYSGGKTWVSGNAYFKVAENYDSFKLDCGFYEILAKGVEFTFNSYFKAAEVYDDADAYYLPCRLTVIKGQLELRYTRSRKEILGTGETVDLFQTKISRRIDWNKIDETSWITGRYEIKAITLRKLAHLIGIQYQANTTFDWAYRDAYLSNISFDPYKPIAELLNEPSFKDHVHINHNTDWGQDIWEFYYHK